MGGLRPKRQPALTFGSCGQLDEDDVRQARARGSGFLVDQLKRASLSIPANIAEGAGRPTERVRMLTVMTRP